MEKRIRTAARPSSSSASHCGVPSVENNFLQVLPPERSFSAASALSTSQRNAPIFRAGTVVKPSRGAIVTETVKKAAYALSKSCLELEQLALDAAEFPSELASGRTDASISSRRWAAARLLSSCLQPIPLVSTSAPPNGFFFTSVPALEESFSLNIHSPTNGARSTSVTSAIPRSQSQPLSPSSPHSILLVPFLAIFLCHRCEASF
jgi:hypothetical protein